MPPGTKGINAQIENRVAGHFKMRAKISDTSDKVMLAKNNAMVCDLPPFSIRK